MADTPAQSAASPPLSLSGFLSECELLTSEAFEIGHLRGHFLPRSVRRGTNALDAQLELVGVGRAREGFVQGDELLGVEIEERLIESLHAVLRSAGGNRVVDQAGLVCI